ncbi:MAG TPA: hypothetical protein VGN11_11175, partial [Candidatus Baltobacteraceae bacterium]|nr:hypothetical protein [Candidatus Baltobacteraceae bacterium]
MSIGLLLVAILFQIAGAAMLVAGAPPLAVLHAFAAFVVLAIVAASHQLIPVFFRCAPMPPGITLAVSAGFIAGFVLLIDAFCGAPTFASAGVILSMSTLTWGTMVLCRLIPARAERSTGVAIGLATASFVVAGVLGALAAAAIGRGSSFPVRLPVIHGSLMILAFASVFVVALSYRFVPMFALAHTSEYGNRAWQFVLIAAA